MYTKRFLILITLLGIAFFCPTDSLTIPVQAAPDTFDCTNINECEALIAFETDRDGNHEIYLMKVNGTGLTNLTANPAIDVDPTWNAAGDRIAFYTDRDGNGEIYVMNSDGSGVTNLTNNVRWDFDPSWSFDGHKIAFVSDVNGNREIYFMNMDGSNQTRLTDTIGEDVDPIWSPDNNQIAFASNRDDNYEIYVMSIDGSNQRRLTNHSSVDRYPAWSPDGQKIAFYSTRNGEADIYVMNVDGSEQTRLTNSFLGDADPAWSIDSTKIIFGTARDGNGEIYIMSADGSDQTRLTNHSAQDWSPVLSPLRSTFLEPTSTATLSPTPTHTPTHTPTPIDTNTVTPTNTGTHTPTSTHTGTATPTNTGTPTPTPTDTGTNTAMPPTHTATATPTNTYTPTPLPTETATSLPPTNMPIPTAIPTDTPTATVIDTPTPMDTPTVTATDTPVHTDSPTPSATTTATPATLPTYTLLPTYTPFPTYTTEPTATSANTPTVIPTATSTATPTSTARPTFTSPPTLTVTLAGGGDESAGTPTVSSTQTPAVTFIATLTSTETATSIATSTHTPMPDCYQLMPNVNAGSGRAPIAIPDRSVGCPENQYQAGESIQLNAQPDIGWLTEGWRGTDDDAQKANSNTITMPATDHEVVVIYTQRLSSLPIKRLQTNCRNITPDGPTEPTGCVVGMVYLHGQERPDITVEIINQRGESTTAQTQYRLSDPEKRAYFHFDLEPERLRVQAGQPYTLHVTYDGVEKILDNLVTQPGHQQVDIVLPSPVTEYPIATINHLSAKTLIEGETLIAQGMGQDQQGGNAMQAYRWRSDLDGIIGGGATLNIPVSELTPGTHQLSFDVQDQLGQWSPRAIAEDILIKRAAKVDWVMLLYLAGDYDDEGKLWDVFQKVLVGLEEINKPQLRIVAQLDGYNRTTQRWVMDPIQNSATQILDEGELAMDEMETLRDFLVWGQAEYPAKHYYLVIADHGQGARGIAWDTTSDWVDGERDDSAYLTVKELGQALNDPQVAPVDVLHLDACSMNLLEIAYEVGNRTQVLIASQYLGWDYFAYDRYAEAIRGDTSPKELGQHIVETYAAMATEGGQSYPYTISALNTQQIVTVMEAFNALITELDPRVRSGEIDRTHLLEIRAAAQSFDSQGDFANGDDDLYIDLKHWVDLIGAELPVIQSQAEALSAVLGDFIVANQRASGTMGGVDVALDDASGVSIFYPGSPYHATHRSYLNDKQFSFVQDSSWRSFLNASVGVLPPDATVTPAIGPQPHVGISNASVPVETSTPLPTGMPSPMPTDTVVPTATPTSTVTPTSTPSPIMTGTPVPTATATPIPATTPMPTSTPEDCVVGSSGDGCTEGQPSDGKLYLPIIKK